MSGIRNSFRNVWMSLICMLIFMLFIFCVKIDRCNLSSTEYKILKRQVNMLMDLEEQRARMDR